MVFDLVLGLVEHKVVAVAGRKKLGDEVLIKGRDHRGSIILFRESNGWVFRERPEGKYFDHRSFVSLKKGDHVVLEHWKGYTTCRFGKFEGSMFERQAAG